MLCERANETFAVTSYKISNFFSVENDDGVYRIVGWLGRAFDDLLTRRSKRKCVLLENLDNGMKDEKGNYTGCLGLLQQNKASLFFRAERK